MLYVLHSECGIKLLTNKIHTLSQRSDLRVEGSKINFESVTRIGGSSRSLTRMQKLKELKIFSSLAYGNRKRVYKMMASRRVEELIGEL